MNNEIDLAEDKTSLLEDQKYQSEFENERDQRQYRKLMFFILGILIIVMFIVSFKTTYEYITHYIKTSIIEIYLNKRVEDNGIIVLLSLILMIPTILSLAMMRFLFGNNNQKEEKNVPSIIFNIGKELKETLITFMNNKN